MQFQTNIITNGSIFETLFKCLNFTLLLNKFVKIYILRIIKIMACKCSNLTPSYGKNSSYADIKKKLVRKWISFKQHISKEFFHFLKNNSNHINS